MKAYPQLQLDNQLCFPLYAASKELVRKYTPLLDPLGLTYTQYIVMMVLWENEAIKVSDMGQKLLLDSGTLTPVLKKLEAKGYLLRKRCADDERCVVCELTDEGRALADKAAGIPAQIGGCLALSNKEAEQLYTLLYKVIGSLS